jgi:hypothetical protein
VGSSRITGASVVFHQAWQKPKVDDGAVARWREIDHLAHGCGILIPGHDDGARLDLSRVASLIEDGPEVAGLVCSLRRDADKLECLLQAREYQDQGQSSSPMRTLAQNSLDWPQRARHTQAQVTVNDEVDTVAAALQAEAHAPTVANHLVFEMLNGFVTVANLLQPGPGYGTTPQDYTAWYQALHASNITVS